MRFKSPIHTVVSETIASPFGVFCEVKGNGEGKEIWKPNERKFPAIQV